MTFLPVIDRELRVAARKRATYWTRTFAAAFVIIVALMVIWGSRRSSPGGVGSNLFDVLSFIAFAYALLAGIAFTADCLSCERREGTLGLLFLTDLKSYDVVLGKIVASSLPAFYGLLAIFPILGIPLLLGGVTGSEFWHMTLVLVVTLSFSLALGAAVSAFSRHEWAAMISTLLGLVVFSGLLPGIWATGKYFKIALPSGVFLLPSPAFAYYAVSARKQSVFWESMAVLSTLVLIFVIVACVILPLAWREKGEARRRTVSTEKQERRTSNRNRLLDGNPFSWLCSRSRRTTFFLWGTVLFLFFGWLAVFGAAMHRGKVNWEFIVSFYSAFLLFLALKFAITLMACRRLHEDRRSGALELMLSTPLPIQDVVEAQSKQLWRQFIGPMFLLALVNVSLLTFVVIVEKDSEANTLAGIVTIGGIATLFSDYFALTRIGMWQALISTRYAVAVFGTMARILVPPWVVVSFIVFVLSTGSSSFDTVCGFIACVFVGSFVFSMYAGKVAEAKLIREFRLAAAGLYRPRKKPTAPATAIVQPTMSEVP